MRNDLLIPLAVLMLTGGCEAAAVPKGGNELSAREARAVPPPAARPAAAGVERSPTKADAPVPSAGFAPFWRSFRQAALAEDATAAAALARFPVVGRGELDDEPEQPIGRAAFPAAFRAALQTTDVIRDPGTQAVREGTMLELIEASAADADAQGSDDSRRFGAFDFARTGEGWRLVGIYIGGGE